PENINISLTPRPGFTLKGFVTDQVYVGSVVKTVVEMPNGNKVKVNAHPYSELIAPGTLVNVYWESDKAVVMHTAADTLYDAIEAAGLILQRGDVKDE
ncbi:MAG: TOBE domain-containing protein, partial [Oscillospiraceae bacterium]|nr:TOBE domain-containing protein [Oscillospiraceae bacterium]